ncbi:MAG TPA: metallophosphoesterase [Chloroflexota bacterium]|nr:metallophosphoesterase [Chloroflexota bacterium]
MAVRLVITADNHLNRYHAKMPVSRLEERRRWLRRAFRRAVDRAIETQADFFLQCGDLFDTVDPRNAERSFVAGCLADLRAAGVEVLAVGGNHDSPRQSTEHGGYLAADLYARLGGMRLFSDSDQIEYECFERQGMQIAIGGVCWNASTSYGDDPLEGKAFPDPPEGRPDWKLLLIHSSLEGHSFPGSFEPVVKRDTIAGLDADYLLVGHVHARTHFEVGGTHVIVPGATERMYLEEFGHDPGFVVLNLDENGQARHEWVTFPAQPRCRIRVTGHELTPQPYGLRPPEQSATDLLLERVEAARDEHCLMTLQLEGRLPREVYSQMDLVQVQEAGNEASFFFEIDTTKLELENEFGESGRRGIRLSQVEELQATAADMREGAVSDAERRVVELALDRVLAHYSYGEGATA